MEILSAVIGALSALIFMTVKEKIGWMYTKREHRKKILFELSYYFYLVYGVSSRFVKIKAADKRESYALSVMRPPSVFENCGHLDVLLDSERVSLMKFYDTCERFNSLARIALEREDLPDRMNVLITLKYLCKVASEAAKEFCPDEKFYRDDHPEDLGKMVPIVDKLLEVADLIEAAIKKMQGTKPVEADVLPE